MIALQSKQTIICEITFSIIITFPPNCIFYEITERVDIQNHYKIIIDRPRCMKFASDVASILCCISR